MRSPVHKAILDAANRIAAHGDGTFAPDEVVRALPHLNENTVRTHIVSRCCIGAPKHHATIWPYFRRVGRGQYKIASKYKRKPEPELPRGEVPSPHLEGYVSEAAPGRLPVSRREIIHAIVQRGESAYFAECLEVAVVTQGKTLDEVVANLQQALALHLEDEDLATLGLADHPRIQIIYDMAPVS
jgi:predicted RNase H-like HicB family nuclease